VSTGASQRKGWRPGPFLIEHVERRQTDVGDFFVAEHEFVACVGAACGRSIGWPIICAVAPPVSANKPAALNTGTAWLLRLRIGTVSSFLVLTTRSFVTL
jgi:hypothetical protein